MNGRWPVFIGSALSLMLLSAPAGAQVFDEYYGEESSIVLHGELALRSDYMFRGQNLYNGPSLQPRFRPQLNTDIGSFYGEAFGHIGLDQGDPKSSRGGTFGATDDDGDPLPVAVVTPAFDEADFELGYKADLELLTLTLAHRWYSYSVHDDSPLYGRINRRLENTAEFQGMLDFDVPLHPHVALAYDYDANEALYYEAGLRQPFMLMDNEQDALVPFVKFGFTSGYDDDGRPIYNEGGLAYVDFGLRSVFYIFEDLSLQPEVHYSEGVDDFTNSEFLFGVTLVGDLEF